MDVVDIRARRSVMMDHVLNALSWNAHSAIAERSRKRSGVERAKSVNAQSQSVVSTTVGLVASPARIPATGPWFVQHDFASSLTETTVRTGRLTAASIGVKNRATRLPRCLLHVPFRPTRSRNVRAENMSWYHRPSRSFRNARGSRGPNVRTLFQRASQCA